MTKKHCTYGDPYCPCQDGDPCHYEGKDPMPQVEQNPEPDYPLELIAILEERPYTSRSVIEAHNLARRTWKQLFEGALLERDVMQRQAMKAQHEVNHLRREMFHPLSFAQVQMLSAIAKILHDGRDVPYVPSLQDAYDDCWGALLTILMAQDVPEWKEKHHHREVGL